MSFQVADSGNGPAQRVCANRTCRRRPTHTVRAYLGGRVPSTIHVCDDDLRRLQRAGALEEDSMSCVVKKCRKTNEIGARFCPDHNAIAKKLGIKIPSTGKLSAASLEAVARVEAEVARLAEEKTSTPGPQAVTAPTWVHLEGELADAIGDVPAPERQDWEALLNRVRELQEVKGKLPDIQAALAKLRRRLVTWAKGAAFDEAEVLAQAEAALADFDDETVQHVSSLYLLRALLGHARAVSQRAARVEEVEGRLVAETARAVALEVELSTVQGQLLTALNEAEPAFLNQIGKIASSCGLLWTRAANPEGRIPTLDEWFGAIAKELVAKRGQMLALEMALDRAGAPVRSAQGNELTPAGRVEALWDIHHGQELATLRQQLAEESDEHRETSQELVALRKALRVVIGSKVSETADDDVLAHEVEMLALEAERLKELREALDLLLSDSDELVRVSVEDVVLLDRIKGRLNAGDELRQNLRRQLGRLDRGDTDEELMLYVCHEPGYEVPTSDPVVGSVGELAIQVAEPLWPLWLTYDVQLCGHVSLGCVEARQTASGGLELRDGSLIGPAAIFRAQVIQAPPPLPEPALGVEVLVSGSRCRVLGVGLMSTEEGPREAVMLTGRQLLWREDWRRPKVEPLAGLEAAPVPYQDKDIPW